MTIAAQELLAVAQAFLGVLFLYSGIAKLLSLDSFMQGLVRIPYLPQRLIPAAAFSLTFAEIGAGGGVLFSWLPAQIAAIGLLLLFAAVAIIAMRSNQQVPCNCFGIDASEYLSLSTVIRNLVLACIAVTALALPMRERPGLTEIFGFILFVLFLGVSKLAQNYRSFTEAFKGYLP